MSLFQIRLFFRIIAKSREVYLLKVVTLAIAFACSTLLLLFSLNEFGFDRFHHDHASVFRILQRNTSELHTGNRLSNRIPHHIFTQLQSADSLMVSRVKGMGELNILSTKQYARQKIYAVDTSITDIFTFDILDGSVCTFRENERTTILSESAARLYFGTNRAAGKTLNISSSGDTLLFSVAAVYKDYPGNSHEEFNAFIRFDSASIEALQFDPADFSIYGKILRGKAEYPKIVIEEDPSTSNLSYELQFISDIYFGPRVLGEDARHGDQYSIFILVCITGLIFFLAMISFINLTTLTLPYRSKEMAVKKLAGTNHVGLILSFAAESFAIVVGSLALGILFLVLARDLIKTTLSIDTVGLVLSGDSKLILILALLSLILGIAPPMMTFKFATASPKRLLSIESITFPRFKRIIIFLQLGISIFLIVSSIVIKRQINYSLVKEPGRNHDQVVYMSFPADLTAEGLRGLQMNWKNVNANIIDVMATSHLPNQVMSKELNSGFYHITVDPAFKDFFGLEMIQGNWFKANDGDSIIVVNEKGKAMLGGNYEHVIGVFRDISGQFNQPGKPIKINRASHFEYNYLCIRILEVDIRKTLRYLSTYFDQETTVSFVDKRFGDWLGYQDRLNSLSEILAIISGLLSCCAVYGLSVSIVRDKLKQIAIHKMCGANTIHITGLLVKEFTHQMLIAILIFGPFTYIILNELLRSFVYSTRFNWTDPLFPVAYCFLIIVVLCGYQATTLNRSALGSALKG